MLMELQAGLLAACLDMLHEYSSKSCAECNSLWLQVMLLQHMLDQDYTPVMMNTFS
jgi:hypothetical protein